MCAAPLYLFVSLLSLNDITYSDLVAFARAQLQKHTPDKSLAKSFDKLKPSQRIDAATIESLESEGLGPEAAAALERLRRDSAKLPPPDPQNSPFHFPRRPTGSEQIDFFRDLTNNALNYTKSLPNYICTETIHRSTARFNPPDEPKWKAKDLLTVKLTYFENRERYELTAINGRETTRSYETSGGAVAEGDFGTQLRELFEPEVHTKFRWDHWTRLRGHLAQVYSYVTALEHSHFRLVTGTANDRQSVTTGRHGFVYADNETHMVLRITGVADFDPVYFPVKEQWSTLDYDMADIGGARFLVPMRSEQEMHTLQFRYKNVELFNDYRKFTGDSSISFTDPDPPKN